MTQALDMSCTIATFHRQLSQCSVYNAVLTLIITLYITTFAATGHGSKAARAHAQSAAPRFSFGVSQDAETGALRLDPLPVEGSE
eukprot:4493-Heterococcus_DN1.PRE.1